jgi:large subunit ribosomal protein L17
MRHRHAYRQLSRNSSHRRALFANMAMALVENGAIRTTDAKAKELRRYAEQLVTMGKEGTLHARRRAIATLGGAGKHPGNGEVSRVQKVVTMIFDDLAPRYKDRHGGYTRIMKIGPRRGDNAPVSIIELVDRPKAE